MIVLVVKEKIGKTSKSQNIMKWLLVHIYLECQLISSQLWIAQVN